MHKLFQGVLALCEMQMTSSHCVKFLRRKTLYQKCLLHYICASNKLHLMVRLYIRRFGECKIPLYHSCVIMTQSSSVIYWPLLSGCWEGVDFVKRILHLDHRINKRKRKWISWIENRKENVWALRIRYNDKKSQTVCKIKDSVRFEEKPASKQVSRRVGEAVPWLRTSLQRSRSKGLSICPMWF